MKYILIALAVALAVYGGYRYGKTKTAQLEAVSVSPESSLEAAASALPRGTVPAATTQKLPAQTQQTPKPAPAMPRIQLAQCTATPNTITLKQGLAFAVDNLDYTSRKVNITSQSFTMGPQSSITAIATPVGIHSILCDGAGVATLTVQP